MASQNKITISFSKEYRDVYEYLKSKGNCSRLTCKIIKAHMSEDNFETKIEKVVSTFLASKNYRVVDDDIKKSINSYDF